MADANHMAQLKVATDSVELPELLEHATHRRAVEGLASQYGAQAVLVAAGMLISAGFGPFPPSRADFRKFFEGLDSTRVADLGSNAACVAQLARKTIN